MNRKQWRRRVVLYRAHEWMKRLIWDEGLSFKAAIEQSIGVCIQNGVGPYAYVQQSSRRYPARLKPRPEFKVYRTQGCAMQCSAGMRMDSKEFTIVAFPGVTKVNRQPLESHPYFVEYDIHRISRNIDRCIEDWTDMTDSWKQLYIETFSKREHSKGKGE